MTREVFRALLLGLVADGLLDMTEAGALLSLWDRGAIPADALPLVSGDSVPAVTEATLSAAVARAVALASGSSLGTVTAATFNAPLPVRSVLLRDLEGAFAREARRRAALLFVEPDAARLGGLPGTAHRSAGNVRRFHTAMRQAMIEDGLASFRLGLGRPPTSAEAEAFRARLAPRLERLQVWTERQSVTALAGEPWRSEKQTASDAVYRQNAREEFFRAKEGADAFGSGYVYDYIAVDDAGTCSPCSAAAAGGPYLEGQGPYPVQVCDGQGHCRCERVARFDADAYADAYARLTGAAVPLAA